MYGIICWWPLMCGVSNLRRITQSPFNNFTVCVDRVAEGHQKLNVNWEGIWKNLLHKRMLWAGFLVITYDTAFGDTSQWHWWEQISDPQIASELSKQADLGQTTNLLITDTKALALSHFLPLPTLETTLEDIKLGSWHLHIHWCTRPCLFYHSYRPLNVRGKPLGAAPWIPLYHKMLTF